MDYSIEDFVLTPREDETYVSFKVSKGLKSWCDKNKINKRKLFEIVCGQLGFKED